MGGTLELAELKVYGSHDLSSNNDTRLVSIKFNGLLSPDYHTTTIDTHGFSSLDNVAYPTWSLVQNGRMWGDETLIAARNVLTADVVIADFTNTAARIMAQAGLTDQGRH